MKLKTSIIIATALSALANNAYSREVTIDDFAYGDKRFQDETVRESRFIKFADTAMKHIKKHDQGMVDYFYLVNGRQVKSKTALRDIFTNKAGLPYARIQCETRDPDSYEEGDRSIYQRDHNNPPSDLGRGYSDFRVLGGIVLAVDKEFPEQYWYYYITYEDNPNIDKLKYKLVPVTGQDCWAIKW